MKVLGIKTPLVKVGDDIRNIIVKSIKVLPEKSILVVTSKIFSFCENRLVRKKTGRREEKHELAKREAEYYLDPHSSKYNLMLTIKGNWMFVNAGIDESNADNQYALWPKDPQKSVNLVWRFLRRRYRVKEVGVIMSDSRSFPLNWGQDRRRRLCPAADENRMETGRQLTSTSPLPIAYHIFSSVINLYDL